MVMHMTRNDAEKILNEWVASPGLRKHMQAVAAAMEWYAKKYGQDPDSWYVAGLLHDMDYEKYPSVGEDGHPNQGVRYLREHGVDEDILYAIKSHAYPAEAERETLMAKALQAVDELSGFIVAVALIKPNKSLAEVDAQSVIKRLKEKRFAANVDRDDIYIGASRLEISLEEHVANVIAALQEIAQKIGL
jgi:putative nucleotidyltransferase with HDIG domain